MLYSESLLAVEVKAFPSQAQRQTRGSDLRAEMEIDLTEAYFGTNRFKYKC